MAQQVVNSAMLMCSFGVAPGTMNVLPINRVMAAGQPAANIMDNKPMMNIMPFGMCTTPSNPQVAAATSAAMGVLTPMPCIPVTTAPWAPGSATVMIANQPALSSTCQLMCMWGGAITVSFAGQATVTVA
jgi:hypothetical protein